MGRGRADRCLRVLMVSLQQPIEGQGARVHLDELRHELAELGHGAELIEARSGRAGLAGPLRLLAVQVRSVARMGRADVVLARFHPLLLPLAVICRLRRRTLVVEVNGTPDDLVALYPTARALLPLLRWTSRWTLRLADERIAVSDPLADWATDLCGRAVTAVPNGANVERFRPEASWAGRPLPERYAVFVGRLAPWQGIDLLVDALAHPAWPQDLALVVAGDGPRAPVLHEVARRDPRVVLLGTVPHDQVPGLIAGAVVAVAPRAPSGWHASPLKVFEALAAGTPVVATDLPGQAAPVRASGGGRIVPTGDPTAFADTVAAIAGDRQLAGRLGTAGTRYVHDHASWALTASRVEEVLHRALQRDVRTVAGPR